MRRLRRDKSKSSVDHSNSSKIISAPIPLPKQSAETPLYARFASPGRQDPPTKPIVSGPIQLTARPSLHERSSGGRGSNQDRNSKVLSRKSSKQSGRQVQEQPKVLPNPPVRTTSRAPIAETSEPNSPLVSPTATYGAHQPWHQDYVQPSLPSDSETIPSSYNPWAGFEANADSDVDSTPPARRLRVMNQDAASSSASLSDALANRARTQPYSTLNHATPRPTHAAPPIVPLQTHLPTTNSQRTEKPLSRVDTTPAYPDPNAEYDPYHPAFTHTPYTQTFQPHYSSQTNTPYIYASPSNSFDATPPTTQFPPSSTSHPTASHQQEESALNKFYTPPSSPTKAGLTKLPSASAGSSSPAIQSQPSETPTVTSKVSAPSLLSTPSIVRRKYSPLAAFGLRTQSNTTTASTSNTSLASSGEKGQSVGDINPSVPDLTPSLVPQSTILNSAHKLVAEPESITTHSPSPDKTLMSVTVTSVVEETHTRKKREASRSPKPKSSSRKKTSPADRQLPATPPTYDSPPPPPKTRQHHRNHSDVSSPTVPTYPQTGTTLSSQNSIVRGKPLIFAAMEDVPDIPDMDPEENAAQAVDEEAGYSAYDLSPPISPPEPSTPRRRKLSKVNRTKSRKDTAEQRSSPTNQQRMEPSDSRTDLRASTPDSSSSTPHRTHKHTMSATAQLGSPLNAQDSPQPTRNLDPRRMSYQAGLQPNRRSQGFFDKQSAQEYFKPHENSHAQHASSQQDTGSTYTSTYLPPTPPHSDESSNGLSSPPSVPPHLPPQPPRSPVHKRKQPSPVESQTSSTPVPISTSQTRDSPVSAPPQLPTPPEEIPRPRTHRREKKSRKEKVFKELKPEPEPEEPKEPGPYPFLAHLSDPILLENLLCYLSYHEWMELCLVSKDIRRVLFEDRREEVLERYLHTIGYARWTWRQPEPLMLTVSDLCSYMRGVSIPSHRYAALAQNFLQTKSETDLHLMQDLAASCRSLTRVILRLRAQAEAEAAYNAHLAAHPPMPSPPFRETARPTHRSSTKSSAPPPRMGVSRASSRAPSPASSFTHGQAPGGSHQHVGPVNTFHSPLFRLRRAPLLQVFVPSPEGDWLSDASVLECEAELQRAGVSHLLRAGDVVWDAAVGDEGNAGRMVWDGKYLIDLDYTYSRVGDPPKYLPTLAFPPSYFHRVIRTMGAGNPIIHIDISPYTQQIEDHLQLVQDRVAQTDTPQGNRHNLLGWVNRTYFTIRPAPGSKSVRLNIPRTAGPGPSPTGAWVVDPGWYGKVVLEIEGTTEGVADLRARCRGTHPQQAGGSSMYGEERRSVFRILRERSRPGEIWIRAVTGKERIVVAR